MLRNRAPVDCWSLGFRFVVFALAATSILSLLVEFFGWWSMRSFTLFVSLPALAGLCGLGFTDRAMGTQRLWRAVLAGAPAGLIAPTAYDIYRLPFVFADSLSIQQIIPPLNLLKVFPRFGAMILG